jgi:hypothetical protein
MKKSDWLGQIDTVARWVSDAEFELQVYTGADNQVDFNDRIVHIDSRLHPENRFYTLLHEYGHLEISATAAEQFASDHPVYVRSEPYANVKSHAIRVSIVAEEFEAWRRGRTRARKEDLFVDDKKYDKQITHCMMAYIDWAAR